MEKSNQSVVLAEANDVMHKVREVVKQTDSILALSTRATSDLPTFAVMTGDKIKAIGERMAEIDRANQAFGRTSSQTNSRLMNLTMMSGGPYRMMHQCLAQIEQKRMALRSAQVKMRKTVARVNRDLGILQCLLADSSRQEAHEIFQHTYKVELLRIKLDEAAMSIADSQLYIEGALREIAQYQAAYEEIRTAHKIKDDWDESDFEAAEVRSNLRRGFQMAYRELVSTRTISPSTLEYLEQMGVAPMAAMDYMIDSLNAFQKARGEVPKGRMDVVETGGDSSPYNIEAHNTWLDQTTEKFADEYKKVLRHIGLSSSTHLDSLYITNKG